MTHADRSHTNEQKRLGALHSTNLLYTPSDAVFDRLTSLAARLLGTPFATLTLIGDECARLKSAVGSELIEYPRSHAFCDQTIRSADALVVPDTRCDTRFASNPFVTGPPRIQFYAGAPVTTAKGYRLGALCVLDTQVRYDFGERKIAILRDLADLASDWIKMRESAGYLDAGTGIFTRQRMTEILESELRQPHRNLPDRIRLVGIVDIAMPRQMHDLVQVMGYDQVEQFIVECINRLSQRIGTRADLYRIGLYRFGFFMAEDECTELKCRLDTLIQALHEPFNSSVGLLLAPSATLGVTLLDANSNDGAEEVLRQASIAADDAWASSRGWARFNSQSHAARQRKLALLTELPVAIAASDQLYLVYQPQIDLVTRECVGVEALLRWTHPRLGPVSPVELIDAAEKTALIRPLTNWVLDTAIGQAAEWRAAGLSLKVAVNLSAHDLSDDHIVSRVSTRLKHYGLPATNLELEFTESTLIDDIDAVIPMLRALAAMGVSTAIDDFGTGYCNLSYMQKLDVSRIKIDRRFVQSLEHNPRDQTLTQAIINLAHALGYQIIAEGIENQATLALVQSWGCEQVQGYLFSRPLDADTLFEWVYLNGARAVMTDSTMPGQG